MNTLSKCIAVGVVSITFCCGRIASAETSTTQLRNQTRNLLRLESIAKQGDEKEDAASALCDLYVVLRSDPRFPTSEMLQGDAAKVRRRLLSIARRREIQLGRKGIERPEKLSRQVETAISESLSSQKHPSDDSNQVVRGETAGGGSSSSTVGGGGWHLVELIQRVIAPDFWDQQGGRGTVQYFAMRRILVVRATSDVHAQIKDLLMSLR